MTNFLNTSTLIAFIILHAFVGNNDQYFKKKNPVHIITTWELPDALEEVSGLSWIGDQKLTAIEDESGLIYIYDLAEKRIERIIEFGDDGDWGDDW